MTDKQRQTVEGWYRIEREYPMGNPGIRKIVHITREQQSKRKTDHPYFLGSKKEPIVLDLDLIYTKVRKKL